MPYSYEIEALLRMGLSCRITSIHDVLLLTSYPSSPRPPVALRPGFLSIKRMGKLNEPACGRHIRHHLHIRPATPHRRTTTSARPRQSGGTLIVDDYLGSAAGRAAAPLIVDDHSARPSIEWQHPHRPQPPWRSADSPHRRRPSRRGHRRSRCTPRAHRPHAHLTAGVDSWMSAHRAGMEEWRPSKCYPCP